MYDGMVYLIKLQRISSISIKFYVELGQHSFKEKEGDDVCIYNISITK